MTVTPSASWRDLPDRLRKVQRVTEFGAIGR